MIRSFFKEMASNPVLDKQGKPIQWQIIGEDYGILTLDGANVEQKAVIEVLDTYAKGRIGGVVVSTPEQNDELKKKFPPGQSGRPSERNKDEIRPFNPPKPPAIRQDPQPGAAPAVVGGDINAKFPPMAVTEAPPGQPVVKKPSILSGDFRPTLGRPKNKVTAPEPA